MHQKNLEKLETIQQRRRFCYFAMGGHSPWFGTLYLKRNHFRHKTKASDVYPTWSSHIEKFPLLKSYIESLTQNIFKEIGRCLFFISYPTVEILIHRDFPQESHKDHCINFFFDSGRPAYIYDEVKKIKHYLEPDCRAYFFNNRDYHGVDAEPKFRYTLRVDGTFKDELSERLGLKDGWVSQI